MCINSQDITRNRKAITKLFCSVYPSECPHRRHHAAGFTTRLLLRKDPPKLSILTQSHRAVIKVMRERVSALAFVSSPSPAQR